MRPKSFYGWWISLAAFCTFGISVGIPYYGMPFFYDYYQKTFGWSRPDITLGFPIAATLTLWVGPLLVHRFSPRLLIVVGTAFTALAFLGFGTMGGSLPWYYTLWFLYMVGYIFSGPIPHQVIVSQWFRKHRGKAMGITYLGVGLFGGLSVKFVGKPLTDAFGFQGALMIIGGLMLLAWPIALLVMRDRPVDVGQYPDGEAANLASTQEPPAAFATLLSRPAFWLLVIGSFCSIGSIGSINQHMKFVFKEQGFVDQQALDSAMANATLCILWSSIGGRLVMGWLADRFPKKYVMAATYFLVAGTIPLLLVVTPTDTTSLYLFSILFGFGMGADYMLIPLMAAEQFGANSLARAMAIILPTDTIGQTWFPYGIARLREVVGSYPVPLGSIFGLALAGAIAISLLPRHKKSDETLHVPEPGRVTTRG
ncbi:MAG: MFS transporter [Acidobacteria bacterium]|nr:MFS transporter [Acidobacteriota bacterium]